MSAPKFGRLVHENALLFDAHFGLEIYTLASGVTWDPRFVGLSIRFALCAGPFELFFELDLMNVLEVKLQLLHRFECFSALRPQM